MVRTNKPAIEIAGLLMLRRFVYWLAVLLIVHCQGLGDAGYLLGADGNGQA